jgi:hypothetical protein
MIYFITCIDKISYENGSAKSFELSFEKYNNKENPFQLIILKNNIQHYGDYNKIIQIFNYLRSNECISKNDDDIFIYLNPYNTLIMKYLDNNIEEIFKKYNEDIIFGATNQFKYIYKDAFQYYNNRFRDFNNKFLDFGFYIGYKKAIIQYFGFIMNKLMYYPKVDGNYNSHCVIGYVFYQKDAKEYSSINKSLQNLKLNLDVKNNFFYVQNENNNILDLILFNSYFLNFSDFHKQKQRAHFLLISKLKDLF